MRTALDLITEAGLAAVSMRKVATRLDTAAASLYVYVDDRNDLIEAAYDLGLAEVQIPDRPSGPWRTQLEQLVENQISILSSHGDLALVALGEAQIGLNSLRITERTLLLLRSGGVSDESCIAAADLLDQYVASTALEQASWSRNGRTTADTELDAPIIEALTHEAARRLDDAYSRLPADDFPVISSLREHLVEADHSARHAWKLEVIIDGLTGRHHTPDAKP